MWVDDEWMDEGTGTETGTLDGSMRARKAAVLAIDDGCTSAAIQTEKQRDRQAAESVYPELARWGCGCAVQASVATCT